MTKSMIKTLVKPFRRENRVVTRSGQILTEGFLRPLKFLIKVSQYALFFPFEWSVEGKKPELRTWDWKHKLWIVKCVLLCLNYSYVLCRSCFLATQHDLRIGEKIALAVVFLYYMTGLVLDVPFIINLEIWVEHIGKTLGFFKFVQDSFYSKSKCISPPRCSIVGEILGNCIVAAGFVNAGCLWIHSFMFPYTAPGGLVPMFTGAGEYIFGDVNPAVVTIGIWIIAPILQLYFLCNISIIGITLVVTVMYDTMIVTHAFEKIREVADQDGKSIFSENMKHVYDAAVLLVEGLEEIYGFSMLCLQNEIMMMAVFSIFVSVRVPDNIGFIGGIPGLNVFVLLAGMFHVLANFHRKSVDALEGWRSSEHKISKQLRKALRARRFIKFSVGESYYVDKMIFLTMCNIVLSGSVNILILTKT